MNCTIEEEPYGLWLLNDENYDAVGYRNRGAHALSPLSKRTCAILTGMHESTSSQLYHLNCKGIECLDF
jgi:hypothetical protein